MNNVKTRRLVHLAIEEDAAPFMIHDEPATETANAWGDDLGRMGISSQKSLAMADVSDAQDIDAEWIRNGEFEVESLRLDIRSVLGSTLFTIQSKQG